MDSNPPPPFEPEEVARRRRNLEALARHMASGQPSAPGPAMGAGPQPGTPARKWGRWGGLAAAGTFVLTQLKFLLGLLKFGKFGGTFISMAFAAWIYSRLYGASFGVGLVLLIFVHELGHWFVIRSEGLPAGAPVFIPFLGAFIALKNTPVSAWSEFKIAAGGPILGSVGALACACVYRAHPDRLWGALAYFGFFLNLFNLLPIHPLDGGRMAGAIHRSLWFVGYALGIVAFIATFSPLLLLILIFGSGNLIRAIRGQAGTDPRYYDIGGTRRLMAGSIYFALVLLLIYGMHQFRFILDATKPS